VEYLAQKESLYYQPLDESSKENEMTFKKIVDIGSKLCAENGLKFNVQNEAFFR